MYNILFYRNENGRSEVKEYLFQLQNKQDKSSQIKFNKITAYINLLAENGIKIGQPYVKYIGNNLWELRPLRDRILFAYYDKNTFILLNVFMKTTRKTPQQEINKAKRLLKDWSDRNEK